MITYWNIFVQNFFDVFHFYIFFVNFGHFSKSPWDSSIHQVWVYREKFNIDFLAQYFSPLFTCIGTSPESLSEKHNVKFFTVGPYFWATCFVGLSKSAENDTYC